MEAFDIISLMMLVVRVFGVVFAIVTIIFIHELGHYLVGRWCGIGASAFSIGFGPELFARTDKRGTRWRVALIPLGGYVKFIGDSDPASMPNATERKKMPANAFFAANAWKRAATVFAGPLANGILTIVVLAFFFFQYGRVAIEPVVGSVLPNTPAASAGLQPGDRIVGMDGDHVQSFDEIMNYVMLRSDEPIAFDIERRGQVLQFSITPARVEANDGFGNKIRKGQIGVSPPVDKNNPDLLNPDYIKRLTYGPLDSIGAAIEQSGLIIKQTVRFIGRLIVGKEDRCQLGGPAKTATIAYQVTEYGFMPLLNLIAFLSISIGLINLVPIPPLDGGHLVFYLYEGLSRRPMPPKMQEFIFKVGIVLVLAFMLFAITNDFIPC